MDAEGRKTGGRQKGTPNKRTLIEREQLLASGELPKEYMLRVMRDPTVDHERRDRMAAQVAPYIHARLAATEVTGKDGADLIPTADSRELAKSIVAALAAAVTDKDPQQD